MVNSIHTKSRPSSSEPSPKINEQLIARQRGWIFQGFRDMRIKYDFYSNDRLKKSPSIEKSEPYDRLTWQSGLNLLQYSLLPILSQQIETLSRLLEPLDLRRDNTTRKLESILELQVEIDHTMCQITEFVAVICPRPPGVPDRTDDNQLQNLKGSRFQGLLFKIKFLNHDICALFIHSSQLIQELKLSPKRYRRQTRKFNHRGRVTQFTELIKESIELITRWLKHSEFHHVQDEWDIEVGGIDEKLAKLTKLINPTITKPVEEEEESGEGTGEEEGREGHVDEGDVEDSDDEDSVDGEEDQLEIEDLSDPAIELARSAMPIIKLSRLFFKKLSRIGNYKFSGEQFTEMSSNQLGRLERSAGDISSLITKLNDKMVEVDVNDQFHTVTILTRTVEDLHPIFDSCILLIILYVVPLMKISPQDHHSSSQSDIDLKTWLGEWNNLFLTSTQNFIHALHTFARSPA
ncbi:hypothetical protein MJO28_006553 [Puccinia striiformis f. sp. tritici]|uniref:Uncharacterized protein n=3 Tax=Puccinia striiformis TaxID=27350 RepID=A0A2S4WN75_9BASI|nr:hypothetical protein Pst134EA_011727 [Puccinia striiformis f. sp. tritici]KAH9468106.1 hypothetical protein Pst134EA_011727 [Puccinia striiformis f. sp. tritici]KAI7954006.1 hypothetical protein MJO28_006553 [Puccinia striiformis f. sp. tritici]POW10948.1 hypothetical protein PSTT_05609 [Puccinia striiformis]POW23225.1 hypothetical protein PSHT_00404 [Puccinia striiformis]